MLIIYMIVFKIKKQDLVCMIPREDFVRLWGYDIIVVLMMILI